VHHKLINIRYTTLILVKQFKKKIHGNGIENYENNLINQFNCNTQSIKHTGTIQL